MRGPYGFQMSEGCQTCKVKKSGFFCQLTPKATKDLDAIKFATAFPKGAVLFMEKQAARGVFLVCEGEVKLTISSGDGKTLILGIAKPGEILGLTDVLSGTPYEMTAETQRPCQIAFIRRDDFLSFVAEHPEASQAVVRQLSVSYREACGQLRTVGLSASAEEKLAKLFLEWSRGAEETDLGARIKLPMTHEEMAECIGSTRETVTRTLSDFRQRHLVTLKGSTLLIPNREALEALTAA